MDMLRDRFCSYVFELWNLGEVRAMNGRSLTSSFTRVHIRGGWVQGSKDSRLGHSPNVLFKHFQRACAVMKLGETGKRGKY